MHFFKRIMADDEELCHHLIVPDDISTFHSERASGRVDGFPSRTQECRELST
jgi:hypothetical protein